MSDTGVIERARDGDTDAFDTLVYRFRDRVYRLALKMMKDPVEAEEVVQDTFLSIHRSLSSFRGESSAGTWIHRIAANSALMRLRTRRRKPLASVEDRLPNPATVVETLDTPGAWAKQPDAHVLDGELAHLLYDAIEALPETAKPILLLRDIEGLSNEEVAEELGL
ncbi:MAG: sigma-70 family RNA polymerase sigma factor, partial [Myxococcota bacterium]